MRWLGRAEPTSGYVVVPRTIATVSAVRVGTWALYALKEARPSEPTFGRFATVKRSAVRVAKGGGFRKLNPYKQRSCHHGQGLDAESTLQLPARQMKFL